MIGAHHQHNIAKNTFFPKDDAPGWIEVFGDRQTRIAMIKQYLDVDGDLIGGTEESLNELINPADGQFLDSDAQAMQNLIKSQIEAKEHAQALAYEREQIKKVLGADGKVTS